jgi:hypothetical protein
MTTTNTSTAPPAAQPAGLFGIPSYGYDPTFPDTGHSSPSFATDTWGHIARSDWERYKQMYQPLEDYLASLVDNPGYNQKMIGMNMRAFDASQVASVGAQQRMFQSYGLSLSPQQQQAFDRKADIQKGLGEVETYNRSSRDLQDMQYAILGAGQRPDIAPKNPPVV